jgi:hypothetical protein
MKLIPGFVLISIAACKEKYNPDIHLSSAGLLVVEGFINMGTEATTISLSRTAAIDHIAEIPNLSPSSIGIRRQLSLSEDTIEKYSINQLSIDASGNTDYILKQLR